MRKTKATNLTLNDGVKAMAKEIQTALHHSSMTSLIEQLIREEYEKRIGNVQISKKEVYPDEPPAKPSSSSISSSGDSALVARALAAVQSQVKRDELRKGSPPRL